MLQVSDNRNHSTWDFERISNICVVIYLKTLLFLDIYWRYPLTEKYIGAICHMWHLWHSWYKLTNGCILVGNGGNCLQNFTHGQSQTYRFQTRNNKLYIPILLNFPISNIQFANYLVKEFNNSKHFLM